MVAEAADGTSGVSAAAESRPDLALVDVQLPDFDGFEVTRRLRESEAGARHRAHLEPRPRRLRLAGETSGARGFVAKGDLSAAALEELLR